MIGTGIDITGSLVQSWALNDGHIFGQAAVPEAYSQGAEAFAQEIGTEATRGMARAAGPAGALSGLIDRSGEQRTCN